MADTSEVVIPLPFRVDLAMGGISDLPEWSAERPGGALGLAVLTDEGTTNSQVAVRDVCSSGLELVLRRGMQGEMSCILHPAADWPVEMDLLVRSCAVALGWSPQNPKALLSDPRATSLRVTVELPLTKGLGSSTITACAVVVALRNYLKMACSVNDVVSLSQEADCAVGAHGGWEDAMPALLGGATKTLSSPGVPPMLRTSRINVAEGIQSTLMLCNTRIPSQTGKILKVALETFHSARKLTVEKSMHLVDEVARAADALAAGDWAELGASLDRQSLVWTSITSGMSTPPTIQAFRNVLDDDIFGGKLAGAGGGGIFVMVCKPDRRKAIEKKMRRVGYDFLAWTPYMRGMLV